MTLLIKTNQIMTDLQKEFEATGYTSWINADLYPDGKIYTQEYTRWLEEQVLALRQEAQRGVSGSLPDATPHTCPECSWLCDCTAQPCSCCSGNDL